MKGRGRIGEREKTGRKREGVSDERAMGMKTMRWRENKKKGSTEVS